jgi:hypothetical protein
MKSARSILTTRLGAIALGGAAIGLAQLTLFSGSAQALTVDKMLFLSTDVSGSINTSEYNTQRLGWSNAFLLPTIQSSIAASPNGIAVAVGQWDSIARTPLAIDWTLLTDNASVTSFAAQLATMARQGSGSTCVSCGINAAVASIQSAISSGLFDSATKIIDISSDGIENVTNDATVRAARDNAASQGININALAIEGDFGATGVTDYYNNNVITPNPGAFVKTVTGFSDFQAAATIKLEREVNGVPGPLPVFGAMAAFGWAGRLRKRVNLAKRNLPAMA